MQKGFFIKPNRQSLKYPATKLVIFVEVTMLDMESDPTQTLTVPEDRGRGFLFLAYIGIIILTAVLLITIYYYLKCVSSYMGSNAYGISMSIPPIDDPQPLRVGETITLKLKCSKLKDNLQETTCTPAELELINRNLVLLFKFGKQDIPVAVLRTFSPSKDALMLRFSLRKSGQYQISCLYWRFNFVGTPLYIHVKPASICLANTTLNIPNPEMIQVSVNQEKCVTILLHDRFDNVCWMEDEDGFVEKFGIFVKTDGDGANSSDVVCVFARVGIHLTLTLKTRKCSIFKCIMTFMGISTHKFMLISMNSMENETLLSDVNRYFQSWRGSTKATLLFLGIDQQVPKEVTISVTDKDFTFSTVMLGLIHRPFLIFYISRRTKVTLVGPCEFDDDDRQSQVSLRISDGIQDSVTFAMKSSQARILLATFGHFAGPYLRKSEFLQKTTTLESKLGLYFSSRRTYIMALHNGDLLKSSIAKSPTTQIDWLKPFIIGLIDETATSSVGPQSLSSVSSVFAALPSSSVVTRPFPVTEWFTDLMKSLFESNDGTGLFIKHPESRRLHPNLASRTRRNARLQEMDFAGAIVGKYINDSLNYGICVNLTHLKFSKSFLASLIGLPVTYEHFETDYPTFYEDHILPVLNDESEDLSLKFETPKKFNDKNKNDATTQERTGSVPLLANGNNISVTQNNKINYLNLLALHILKNRHLEEIQLFRNGFYKVIPQHLVADFDIDELERLICGGKSAFKMQDLKANHRIVGDFLDHAGLSSDTNLPRYNLSEGDRRKLIHWFWMVIENLSNKEQLRLLLLVTGSSALPTCGFKDLSPKFTISLTGGYNQAPKYHPNLHTLSIGKHSSFKTLEKNIVESLYSKSELGICLHGDNAAFSRRISESHLEIQAQNEHDEASSWMAVFCRVTNGCTIV